MDFQTRLTDIEILNWKREKIIKRGGREDGGVELNSIMIRVTLPGMLKIRGHSLSVKNKGLSINARDVKVCENFICEDKTFLYAKISKQPNEHRISSKPHLPNTLHQGIPLPEHLV